MDNGINETNDYSPVDQPAVPPPASPPPFEGSENGIAAGSAYESGGSNDVDETLAMHAQPYADLTSRAPASAISTTTGNVSDMLAGTPYGDIQNQQKALAQNAYAAQQKYIQSIQDSQNQYQTDVTTHAAATKAELAKIQSDGDQYVKQIADGKIDPNSVWHKADTGNKIAATIGLALGAFGASLGKSPNYALQIYQNAQDRDIEAQKANLGKAQTLYSMNMQKYGNAVAADAATRLQMNQAYQGKLQAAGLGLQSAQSAQALQQANIGLQQQSIPLALQLAQFRATGQILNGGGPSGSTGQGGMPQSQVPQSILTDPVMSKRLVNVPQMDGSNRTYMAMSDPQAEMMQKYEPMVGKTASLLQQLDQIGPMALAKIGDAPAKASALMAQLKSTLPALQNLQIGSSRPAGESGIDAAEQSISDPTSVRDLFSKGVKSNVLFRNILEDAERQRSQNLIGYKSMTSIPKGNPGFK